MGEMGKLRHRKLSFPAHWKLSTFFLLVPPSIENEDLEELIKVPEGQTAQLVCNATGEVGEPGLANPRPEVTHQGSLHFCSLHPPR